MQKKYLILNILLAAEVIAAWRGMDFSPGFSAIFIFVFVVLTALASIIRIAALTAGKDVLSAAAWIIHGDVLRPLPDEAAMDTDPYFVSLYGEDTADKKAEIRGILSPWGIIERPKMLYNEKNDNYVLWFHSDGSTEKNAVY